MSGKKNRIRWFQFRLRTLLLVTMLAGPLLAGAVSYVQRLDGEHKERVAKEEALARLRLERNLLLRWISLESAMSRLESRVTAPRSCTEQEFQAAVAEFQKMTDESKRDQR